MANKLYEESNIQAIANAIRAKGQSGAMTVAQMAGKINAIGTKENITWHQCPQVVRDYLAYVEEHPYPNNNYSISYISDFYPTPALYQNTKPVRKLVDGVSFGDEVPLEKVLFETENMAGTLKPLDHLRWINTTIAPAPTITETGNVAEYCLGNNVRDLGGWECDGGTVKYGILVRGGEINPEDKNLMVDKIGIRQEISLLPTSKQIYTSSPWDIDYVCNPTDTDFQYSVTMIPDIASQWKLYLQTIFDCARASKPVYFHCGVGADKTGTLACVLLALLGVSENEISQDFELTSFAVDANMSGAAYRPRSGYFSTYIAAVKSHYPVDEALVDQSEVFRNNVITFVLSLGFTIEDINDFRNACIDGSPEQIEVQTHSISKSGQNVQYSNTISTINHYSQYMTNIEPTKSNRVITDITVEMNGVDITEYCVSGTKVPYGDTTVTENGTIDVTWLKSVNIDVQSETSQVIRTLGNSTTNNNFNVVETGQGYGEVITADSNYKITDIVVTMNGVNITSSCAFLID